jgi:arginyl-tRNA--protein-N-Asp/Glu arginylyltransferase
MPLAPRRSKCGKREANKGAWTAEEDQKLARVIEIHGPKRWRSIAAKAGILNECMSIITVKIQTQTFSPIVSLELVNYFEFDHTVYCRSE